MSPDATHPARRFEGIFRLENGAAPAVSVPGSHADPDQAPDRREGEADLTVGAGTHGIRLDGELRSGGSTYTLHGTFIDPARPNDAAGTLVPESASYVITVRDRTLNLDGKPWELAKL